MYSVGLPVALENEENFFIIFREQWNSLTGINVSATDRFQYIKNFSLAVRLKGHKRRGLNDMFIHFYCLCPLGLNTKLNFNMLKVTY